ncbi:MAG: 3-oxoacyl-[acyl-carrier-protein] reductase [Bacillota bacterium]|nr:3-oxoacyl-[acyl-carrier-protein] reductase [Bacillota bacterium]
MNKTAIITGGARGIGRAAAIKLAEDAENIVIIYRSNDEAAAATCEEIRAAGAEAKAVKLDVADFDAVKVAMEELKKEFGQIDVLVNCAGITKDGLLAMMKESGFDEVIGVNLKGTYNMIRHCTPYFMKQRKGSIINVTSVSGIIGNAGQTNYSASKAGVIGLTKAVAKELVSRGIRCNAVAPGFIETEMTAGIDENNEMINAIPMKRMGKPEEVAELISFLASDKAAYITGEIIRVDGGIAI